MDNPGGRDYSISKGVSVSPIPDMPDPGPGAMTNFLQQRAERARLQFYHDHAFGITRLNVYAGEAAGYVITDASSRTLSMAPNLSGVNPGLAKILPDIGIPLVIQDKTFVDPATIDDTDPTWTDPLQKTFGTSHRSWSASPAGTPVAGDLWYPTYMSRHRIHGIPPAQTVTVDGCTDPGSIHPRPT